MLSRLSRGTAHAPRPAHPQPETDHQDTQVVRRTAADPVMVAGCAGRPAGKQPEADERSGPDGCDKQRDPDFTARKFQRVEIAHGRDREQ